MKQLMSLFYQYAELAHDIPPATSIERPQVPVKVRSVEEDPNPDTEDDLSDGFMIVPVDDEEVKRLGLDLCREDITFNIMYDIIGNVWLFSYYPEGDLGFEVMGSSFEEVIYAAKVVFRSRIAEASGNIEACLDLIEEEHEYFIDNRWGE